MEQELTRHKRADAVKWALTLVAFIIVGVLLAGIIVGWFGGDTAEDEEVEAEDETAFAGGMVITPEGGSGAISLSFSTLSAVASSEDTLIADGDTVVITATVGPDNNASNTGVDWSIAWNDASSSWATGKTVTDYVTVTPAGDDYVSSKTATMVNLRPFGEQIVVTATSRDNPNYSGSCVLDYAQKVTDFSLSFGDYSCVFGGNTGVTVELNSTGTPTGGSAELVSERSEDYTIATDVSVEYQLSVEGMYDSDGSLCEKYWLKRTGNMYGVYYYAQFFSYTTSNDYDSLTYDALMNYSVADGGLYFGIAFMCKNLGLTFSSGGMGAFPVTTTDYTPAGLMEMIDGPATVDGSAITYTNTQNDMFTLTVTVKSEKSGVIYSTLEKSTTFVMSGYTNTSTISGVSTDYSSVIF